METPVLSYLMAEKGYITEIIVLSLAVSGTATLLGSAVGVPVGAWLGISDFPGKRSWLRLIYTLMALPPVLAGLVVYLLLSRSGPLGELGLLFTPWAMIAAQFLLVTPIVTGLTAAAVAGQDRLVYENALSLGATRSQANWTVIKEAKVGIVSAVMTGFGRALAEVGAVMLVGGNIKHHTRVLTTAIVMETRQGNFELAVALGIILLVTSFVVSSIALLRIDEFRLR